MRKTVVFSRFNFVSEANFFRSLLSTKTVLCLKQIQIIGKLAIVVCVCMCVSCYIGTRQNRQTVARFRIPNELVVNPTSVCPIFSLHLKIALSSLPNAGNRLSCKIEKIQHPDYEIRTLRSLSV